MAEHERVTTSRSSKSVDMISLDEAQTAPDSGPGATSSDSILNAAEMFQSQLEQMTAWKHQLAEQMELMRRDGIKLLERQKNLALEKKRAAEERDALLAERTRLQSLQNDIETESKRLAQRAAELEQAHLILHQLQSEKDRFERDLASARQESDRLAQQKSQTAAELAAAESRLAEVRAIEARRDDLRQQVTDAEARLAALATERDAVDTARHALTIEQAELVARQKSLADQEAHLLAEDVRLKESVEQLEAQRLKLADAQRQTQHDKESLAQQHQQIAAREETLAARAAEVAQHEQAAAAARAQVDQTHAHLSAAAADLEKREQALAEKTTAAESELSARLAAAHQLQQQAADDRQAIAKQRHDLQRKLEAVEDEHAEQLETLAKQTKRLTERRMLVEAAEQDLEKALEGQISKATAGLREELTTTRAAYEQRIAQLDARITQTQAAADQLKAAEAALQQQLSESDRQLNALRHELQATTASLANANEEKIALARDLAAQIDLSKADAQKWQAALDAARAQSTGGDDAIAQAHEAAAQARAQLETLQNQLAEHKKAREELEFRLEVQAEESTKALESLRSQLLHELHQREAELLDLKQKQNSAVPAAAPADFQNQLAMLEQQRNDLANHLFAVQDALRRQEEESLLAKNVFEGKLLTLEQQNARLQAEYEALAARPAQAAPSRHAPAADLGEVAQAQEQILWHKERLLRQAKSLRAFRQQVRDYKTSLESSRTEIAHQREQLRARKENLEQVKRLLEKQEMVMARKLADHNAIKTVAAVGIFVIMILGSSFFGVYRFVHPVFRSEAVVQLAPPAEVLANGGNSAELQTWLNRQMEFMRTSDVTYAAWKILRSADEHYAMHDVREEWLNSLGNNLTMQLDSATKTLAIRYTGPDAEGVSQVCNALAAAYTTPGVRESTDASRSLGLGAQTMAKATVSAFPVKDSRLMVTLYVVASALFVSLLLVILFRHFVARQLREIDQMADAQDLDDMNGDLKAANA